MPSLPSVSAQAGVPRVLLSHGSPKCGRDDPRCTGCNRSSGGRVDFQVNLGLTTATRGCPRAGGIGIHMVVYICPLVSSVDLFSPFRFILINL